jgi:Sel1 repeat-containing protein
LNGRGVPKDTAAAALWFRKAAEQGDAGAQFQLAVMYCTGVGVVRNLEEAVKWYRRSAEQGDRYAQYNLAVMLLKGQGASQEPEQAVHWCCEAAEQGLAEAQLQLGDLYCGGLGIAEDLSDRIYLVRESRGARKLGGVDQAPGLAQLPSGVVPVRVLFSNFCELNAANYTRRPGGGRDLVLRRVIGLADGKRARLPVHSSSSRGPSLPWMPACAGMTRTNRDPTNFSIRDTRNRSTGLYRVGREVPSRPPGLASLVQPGE